MENSQKELLRAIAISFVVTILVAALGVNLFLTETSDMRFIAIFVFIGALLILSRGFLYLYMYRDYLKK